MTGLLSRYSTVLTAVSLCGPALAAEPAWRWDEQESSVALIRGEQVVWRLEASPDEPKPYFHPVALPGGPALTWNRPPDHPWHHALWFSWKYLNGVNFWEPRGGSEKPDGQTLIEATEPTLRSDHSARIEMDLSYRIGQQPPLLTEKRVVEISAPEPSGRYHFDWTSMFTAGEADVVFDRTPLPGEPGGQPWGGYAGLSVRLAKNLTDRAAATTNGPAEFEDGGRHRSKAKAMDYNGVIDGRAVGIAICDHPENLNHPTPWYAIRDKPMSYFSPATICYGPHTLKAGQNLVLRYRVIVHADRWDVDRLEQEFQRFIKDAADRP